MKVYLNEGPEDNLENKILEWTDQSVVAIVTERHFYEIDMGAGKLVGVA